MPSPQKQIDPHCKDCNVKLVPGINCRPSAFGTGTYRCRDCRSTKDRENRGRKISELGLEEVRRKERERMDQWRKSNPEKDLAAQIRQYGITVDQLKQLEEDQNKVCKLCDDPPRG